MPITATALLRLRDCKTNPDVPARTESLEDALLLHTEASFGSEPDSLSELVYRCLGAQLEQHQDPRGIFFLPSVAAPKARNYEGVIAEVGEGGMWAPMPVQEEDGFALPDGLGALGAVLGSMMQHMPQSLIDAAGAAARGDMGGLSQVSDRVASALGQAPQGSVDMASLANMVAGSGIDFSSPMFQQMLATVQGELEKNPEQMQKLAEQLFGQGAPKDDEE